MSDGVVCEGLKEVRRDVWESGFCKGSVKTGQHTFYTGFFRLSSCKLPVLSLKNYYFLMINNKIINKKSTFKSAFFL